MISMNFNKSKILFICPAFYEYPQIIKSKLEDMGAEVFYFSEKKHTIIDTFLLLFSSKLHIFYSKFHYWRIWRKVKNESFDYLFVIKGYGISNKFLNNFRLINCKSKSILYQWDSKSSFNYEYLINSFDKVFSFDFKDVEKDRRLTYQQLFASDEIIKHCSKANESASVDLFFLASYTYQRYLDLLQILTISNKLGLNVKYHLLIKRKTFFKEKFSKGRLLHKDFLTFTPMSRKEYVEILNKSNIVVDSSHSAQSGLTMRSIEALAAGKKLLTSNTSFSSFLFKQNVNIRVGFTSENLRYFIEIKNDFNQSYDLLAEYSVSTWINRIFERLRTDINL